MNMEYDRALYHITGVFTKDLKTLYVIMSLLAFTARDASAKDTGFSSAFPDSVAMNEQKSFGSLSPAAGSDSKGEKTQMPSYSKPVIDGSQKNRILDNPAPASLK